MSPRVWRSRSHRSATAARAAVALALAWLAVAPASLHAQRGAPAGVVVRAGELVRVHTAQWQYTGTLTRVANDSATILFDRDSVHVPRADVLRAEVQRGTRRSTGRIIAGSLIGAAAGAVIGGYTGMLLECGSSCDDASLEGIVGFLGGATLGTLAGGIGGGVWGARKRYPLWQPAVLPERAP